MLPSSLMELRRRRITEAQRAGLRNRIRDQWHVPEAKADAVLDAWAIEARERGPEPGQGSYWQDSEVWIGERLGRRQMTRPIGVVLDP